MTKELPAIPLTGVPFPKSEYERRRHRVFAAMERSKLDALLVTSYGHVRYFTGYHGYRGDFAPFPLILAPGRAPIIVVREFEMEAVRAESCIDEIVGYPQQYDFAKECDVLRRLGLQNSRIGFELGCWNLAPADVHALEAKLSGMQVVDATRLVASVAAVKSEAELDLIRGVMALTDLAARAFQKSLREGVTESEVSAIIEAEVNRAGGEMRPARTLVFGERTRLAHGSPMPNPIRKNQPGDVLEVGMTLHMPYILFGESGCLGN